MKRISLYTFAVLPCLLISLSTFIQANELAKAHQYTDQQLAILKTLWISSAKQTSEPSNRVLNNKAAINLGHKIFFDKRFSKNNQVSCASCHHPDKYFSDGFETAKGISTVNRNAPTIVGSSHGTWFFHDGRSDSLWAQALGPLENEQEHGGNRGQYAKLIYTDPVLRAKYEAIFGIMPDLNDNKRFPDHAGPVRDKNAAQAWKGMQQADQDIITDIFVNTGKAIAAYETQLQPAPSRFDNYINALMQNDINKMEKQLSTDELKGLRLFIGKANCTICHIGPMFTDNGFHNISIPARKGKQFDWGRYTGAKQVLKSPFNCRSHYNDAKNKSCDELEYIVLNGHETLGAIKTPSLRNVTKTAPYMHAGQYKTLHEVIKHYNDPPAVQNRQSELFPDIELNEQEMKQLEAFLHSLNSEIDAEPALLVAPDNAALMH